MNADVPQRIKYPRTPHLPSSPGRSSDDKVLASLDAFAGVQVVMTEKLDGEASTIYPDGYSHARSLDSAFHPSRSRLRALAAQISAAGLLAPSMRLCGENLYATHSIAYTDLEDFFALYSIWSGPRCLSWDATEQWAAQLGLSTVPVLYRGPMLPEKALHARWNERCGDRVSEGFVVRVAGEFQLEEFGSHVAKWVRPDHVQTDEHWAHGPLRTNSLRPR